MQNLISNTDTRLITAALFIFACFNVFAATPMCVMHLKFDDGTGFDTVLDSSGSENDGVLVNMDSSTDWVSGVTNNMDDYSLDFDGDNDYVVVPDDDSLDFGADDFTVAYWFIKHTTSLYSNGVSKWHTGASPGNNEWLLNPASGYPEVHKASFVIETSATGGYGVNDPNTFSLNEWHHLAGVRKDNTMSLYVDGVLVAFRDDLTPNATINNVGAELRVGINQPLGPLFPTDGQFDDIHIYRFAASDGDAVVGDTATEQIGFLYNNPGVPLAVCDPENIIFRNGFEQL